MKESKLSILLKTLSSIELNRFQKFLASPYFNQRQDLQALFQAYLKSGKFLEQENAFRVIYPGMPFDYQKWQKAKSLLLKQLEQFLVLERTQFDLVNKNLQLSAVYRERNLPKSFTRTIQQTHERHFKNPIRNATYYDKLYEIHFQSYLFASSRERQGDHFLQELSDTADISFIAKKLQFACLATAHKTINQSEYQIALLELILDYLQSNPELLELPLIGLYYYCYQAITQPEKPFYFNQFRKLLSQHAGQLSALEIRDLYLLAINFQIRQLNAGKSNNYSIGLELFKEGLHRDYLFQEGVLSRYSYYNCVVMAVHSKEFEWAAWFINHYKKFLPESHRESAYSFTLLRLEYERKNYDKALQLLQNADYSDLLMNLSAKTFQLRIYFELGEFDLLENHLSTMQTFLNRKKVMGYHKANYRNIIKYTKKLIALNPYSSREVAHVKQAIEKEDILTERGWLLGRLNEMKGIKK